MKTVILNRIFLTKKLIQQSMRKKLQAKQSAQTLIHIKRHLEFYNILCNASFHYIKKRRGKR